MMLALVNEEVYRILWHPPLEMWSFKRLFGLLFQATGTNRVGPSSTVSNDTMIVVVEGVDAAIFVDPACVPVNQEIVIQVEPYTGTCQL